ncbi:complex I subunit 1 family protein [Opitutus sp. ER46]|uniref:complex I subunit 1/NuoH family protein n=1 Tax=Opitutus sp. ER46 TaxID=2161864 RepID=UPI000D327DD2|nr:complex I subunit 1 family protein [Opitutus sp. ER46]PTX95790.1 hydroxyacid dehydrogenase [Opitutus sp. ER46]
MVDFYLQLPLVVQGLLKGLAAILVIFPIAGVCSMAERKVAAWVQDRPGPSRAVVPWFGWIPVVGPFLRRLGVFHVMADGGKMLFKEDPVPGHVNKFYFILAPILAMVPALTTVTTVPYGAYVNAAGEVVPVGLTNLDIGILAIFAVASLGVYSVILAGWASNSKYPFLGGIRASAQLISYELSMTLSVIPVFLWLNEPGREGTMSLARAVEFQSHPGFLGGMWFIFIMPISAFVFLVSLFAETNRQPFDMPEGEADLVGGFHTEYGAFKWGLFFVAEYSHMLIGSAVFTLLFLGGWNPLPWISLAQFAEWTHLAGHPIALGLVSIAIFILKVLAMIFFFMWVRWTLPRFRYDQVMEIGWKRLLPLSIVNLVVYAIAIAVIERT